MFRFAKEVNSCLLKIQQGDTAQFEQLVNLTASHLRAIARLYLANKSLDEDVVSCAYLKVLQYINSFDCKQDGYNWLCKITQNLAQTENLKEKRNKELKEKLVRQCEVEDYATDFDEANFFSDIDCLDEIDKIIAFRRFYLDETQQAIGRRLNLSKPAVCKRIKNICKIVKRNYKNK